jgi:gliding motility-associated-like protein
MNLEKCNGESLIIFSEQANSNNILWNNGSTNPSLIVNSSGIYIVSSSNKCGVSTNKFTIEFKECDCSVYIPNTFTPDEDEFNQVFRVKTDCDFYDFHLEIYNRWGEIVFESADANEYWDGNYGIYKAQDGVYSYKVSYVSNLKPDRINLSGHVSIIK